MTFSTVIASWFLDDHPDNKLTQNISRLSVGCRNERQMLERNCDFANVKTLSPRYETRVY